MNTTKYHIKVKHVILLLTAFLLTGLNFKAQAQNSDIILNIEIVDASSPGADDAAIIVEVQSGGSDFSYMLYNKEPWKGGKKLVSDVKSGNTHTFTDLKSGNYYVCVQNKEEATKCTNVTIKPKK